ncbi:MAG: hypothetical protein IH899_15110, partial [Planctomycetes bacterium]|nr:hypothetical protein [Planctomycetota bacterium]
MNQTTHSSGQQPGCYEQPGCFPCESGQPTRRDFFEHVNYGVCGAALTYLFGQDLFGGSGLLAADSKKSAKR